MNFLFLHDFIKEFCSFIYRDNWENDQKDTSDYNEMIPQISIKLVMDIKKKHKMPTFLQDKRNGQVWEH